MKRRTTLTKRIRFTIDSARSAEDSGRRCGSTTRSAKAPRLAPAKQRIDAILRGLLAGLYREVLRSIPNSAHYYTAMPSRDNSNVRECVNLQAHGLKGLRRHTSDGRHDYLANPLQGLSFLRSISTQYNC